MAIPSCISTPWKKQKGKEINKQISNKMDLKKSKGIICWTFSFSKLPFNISITTQATFLPGTFTIHILTLIQITKSDTGDPKHHNYYYITWNKNPWVFTYDGTKKKTSLQHSMHINSLLSFIMKIESSNKRLESQMQTYQIQLFSMRWKVCLLSNPIRKKWDIFKTTYSDNSLIFFFKA